MQPAIASVLLDVAIDRPLDYQIPDQFLSHARPGMRVEVLLRGKPAQGYLLEVKGTSSFSSLKPIVKLLAEEEFLPEGLMTLALWMSEYYCSPLHKIFKMMVPSSVRQLMRPKEQLFVRRAKTREELAILCRDIREKAPKQAAILEELLPVTKGILLSELLEKTKSTRSAVDALVAKGALHVEPLIIDRSPLADADYFLTKPKELNPEQSAALQAVAESMEQKCFQTHLLYGVTGSGKTEVYLQAIEMALAKKQGVIFLVPEIALTSQTVERLRSRFEKKIALLHHRMSEGERCDTWRNLRKGELSIVIGARSAIFSPLPNLGLIIVDEEHESSYKQTDEAPCYHARDIAVMRGKLESATVILGSATPSLESFTNAIRKKYHLSRLTSRADTSALPKVTIVDMKREFEKAQGFTNFSEPLIDGIKARFEAGEQTILFLNRRGYHTMLLCQGCGQAVRCPHCEVALTFHYSEERLSCHLCDYTLSPPPTVCPGCKMGATLKFRGVGTELVERSLHALFPEIRSLRMDADTTRHKGSHQKLLRQFATGKADVLIGTQMIAKGLHFPQVTLVGVLNSDTTLQIPDFRASEIAFQLLTQVAGRAGRGFAAGEVIIQTMMPDNWVIQVAAAQDYDHFYEEESKVRQMFHYPPFSQMVKLVFSSKSQEVLCQAAEMWRRKLLESLSKEYEVMPLIPCGHAKIKDNFRYQFFVRGPSSLPVCRTIVILKQQAPMPNSVKCLIDVHPLSTFF